MTTAALPASTPAAAVVAEPSPTMSGRVKKTLSSRLATVVALVIAILWTIPTAGLFISSFRPAEEIRTSGWWNFFTSPSFTLDNYDEVLFSSSAGSGQLAGYFINSIVITVPTVLFALGLAAFAAYALAWIPFRGSGWLDAIHPEDRDRVERDWRDCIGTGKVFDARYRVRTKTGSYRHFDVRAVPIERDGRIVEWVGASTDVTGQREARARLPRLSPRLRRPRRGKAR